MRQIKFKGKRIRPEGVEDAWAYGSLIQRIDSTEIFDGVFTWFVDPDTVSQFTGLVDKNGKEVYHKDRVNHEDYGEGIIEWDDRFAAFFVNFGIEDLELEMIILNECELLNEKQ